MAGRAGCRLVFEAETLPALPGALALAADGRRDRRRGPQPEVRGGGAGGRAGCGAGARRARVRPADVWRPARGSARGGSPRSRGGLRRRRGLSLAGRPGRGRSGRRPHLRSTRTALARSTAEGGDAVGRRCAMDDWRNRLRGDPLPWLLDEAEPAVRHLALRELLDRPADDPEVRGRPDRRDPHGPDRRDPRCPGPSRLVGEAGRRATRGSTAARSGQLVFLDQLGADPDEPRVRAACDYVLAHSPGARRAASGRPVLRGGAAPAVDGRPLPQRQPAARAHRVRLARRRARRPGDRLAGRRDHGRGRSAWNAITPGPGFCCGANEGLPCAWGATKALLALARIPPERRSPAVRAGDRGVGRVPPLARPGRRRLPDGLRQHEAERLVVQARLPVGLRDRRPAGARGARRGRCRPRSAACERASTGSSPSRTPTAAGRTVTPTPARCGRHRPPGAPSRWVTLRACRVLRATG